VAIQSIHACQGRRVFALVQLAAETAANKSRSLVLQRITLRIFDQICDDSEDWSGHFVRVRIGEVSNCGALQAISLTLQVMHRCLTYSQNPSLAYTDSNIVAYNVRFRDGFWKSVGVAYSFLPIFRASMFNTTVILQCKTGEIPHDSAKVSTAKVFIRCRSYFKRFPCAGPLIVIVWSAWPFLPKDLSCYGVPSWLMHLHVYTNFKQCFTIENV